MKHYTGLRQGEVLDFIWNDFKDGCLNINKTISKETVNNVHIINSLKNVDSIREVKLDDELIKNLEVLKKYYQNMIGFEDNWFIFGGLNLLLPSTIGRKKSKYCEKANVKKIRMHDFRHSHASLLLSKNVPITVISKRLGHSDIDLTFNVYSHMISKDEDKVVNFLNQIKQK